jgi:hypothetical protein
VSARPFDVHQLVDPTGLCSFWERLLSARRTTHDALPWYSNTVVAVTTAGQAVVAQAIGLVGTPALGIGGALKSAGTGACVWGEAAMLR